jgi:predicted TIM-barrel fold metal-dependent hydrolase
MPTDTRQPFPVFDSDSHLLETAAVWERYLESEYRVLARTWFWHAEGEAGPFTILNGRQAPGLPLGNIPRHAVWRPGMTPEDIGALDPRTAHAANPGASDPHARLADMDAMGVDAALLFPTLFGEYFPVLENPDVAAALARAYNDWALDFASAAPARLMPAAVLPLQEVNAAIAEARRAAGLGFRAVTIRPVFNNGRYPAQAYYLPLWRELERLGLVACIHPWAGPAAAEMDANAPFVERVTANLGLGHPAAEFVAPTMDNAVFLIAILADGLLEKFPGLRLHFAHSGVAWLPVALEKTETYLWLGGQAEPVSLEPEHVFFNRRNALSFESGDGSVRRMPGELGRVAAWGSRYPAHDTSEPAAAMRELRVGGIAESTIDRLMGGNAAELLGVQVPAAIGAAR